MPQESGFLGTSIMFALGKPDVPTVGTPLFLATNNPLAWFKPTEAKTEKTVLSAQPLFFSERSERCFFL
jgi:hypothetical protein